MANSDDPLTNNGGGVQLNGTANNNENRLPLRPSNISNPQAQPTIDYARLSRLQAIEIRDLELSHSREIKKLKARIEELEEKEAELEQQLDSDEEIDECLECELNKAEVDRLNAKIESLEMAVETTTQSGTTHLKTQVEELSDQVHAAISAREEDAAKHEAEKEEMRAGFAAVLDSIKQEFEEVKWRAGVNREEMESLETQLKEARAATGVKELVKPEERVREVYLWDEEQLKYVPGTLE